MAPAILVLALATATIALGVTGALFTDTDTIANNSFATGSVTLGTTAANLPFSVTDMAPGDTEGAYDVDVSNDGSLEHRYAITSTTTEDTLAGQLDIWVWAESAEDDSVLGTNNTCDATPGGGNVSAFLYQQGVLGSTGTTNVVGDPAQGSQTGDRVLAAGGSEVLCFYVELPDSTGNTYEGLSTAADFAFEAEQTANNP
jgi:hypothetical protein